MTARMYRKYHSLCAAAADTLHLDREDVRVLAQRRDEFQLQVIALIIVGLEAEVVGL